MKKVICLLVIVLSILCGCDEELAQYNDTTSVESTQSTESVESTESTEALESETAVQTEKPAVTPPDKILEVRKPQNIPDGVEEEILIQNKTSVAIEYYINDDTWCTFTQGLFDGDKYLDSDGAVIEEITVDGITVTLAEYNDENSFEAVWNDGEYVYRLGSYYLSKEELLNVIKSVE